jgi:hypothetical protein
VPRAKSFKVSLNLPFGLGGVEQTWEPNDAERRAAWELYVELATRVATAPIQRNAGLHRHALDSLHALFAITRDILRRYGPEVAQPNDEGFASFGTLAVTVLNEALRPLLRTWQPLLQDHEDQRPADITRVAWERQWERYDELTQALEQVRETITQYSTLLANVAGVPVFIVAKTD